MHLNLPITGHTFQLTELQRDIAEDNVAHAYLFSGIAHLGKMTVGHWFAEELLLNGTEGEERDQKQQQLQKLIHPDVLSLDQLWIEGVCEDWDQIAKTTNIPQVHRSKTPKAKTDTISIDDIRSLQERLTETGLGKRRVCIIRSIERFQDTAANAFLKILEEPPPGLTFILTTENNNALLPTIVSRARNILFQSVPRKELLPLLSGIEEDDAKFILHLSQGCPGTVILLAKDPDLLRSERVIQNTARAFWNAATALERRKMLTPLEQRGDEANAFLLHLNLALRLEDPTTIAMQTEPLLRLAANLQTNAYRPITLNRFVLEVS